MLREQNALVIYVQVALKDSIAAAKNLVEF